MRFVIKDYVYLKFALMFSEMWTPGRQHLFSAHKPAESASPQPDLLEFASGSDVFIVVKHEYNSF